MERRTTPRGFDIVTFTDYRGNACSLQKSSSADLDCVWLGSKDIGLKHFVPGAGWQDVSTSYDPTTGESWMANNRMHLTRDQVRDLLPYLQHFAETGELVDPPE